MPPTEIEALPDRSDAKATGSLLGVSFLLCLCLTRAFAPVESFQYWSTDPTVLPIPETSIGPILLLAINAATILAAAVVCFCIRPRSTRAATLEAALLIAGMGPAIYHSAFARGISVEDAHTCFSWIAAMSAGVAAARASSIPTLRRLIIATLVGGVCVLAAKGIVQVYVEHPGTVAAFKANRAAVLASHGWSDGSPMARAFEHRLLQPEASVWFGLSNITAALAAAATGLLFAMLLPNVRSQEPLSPRTPRSAILILLAGFAASGLLLVLAGAKGGYAATAIVVLSACSLLQLGRTLGGLPPPPRIASMLRFVPIALCALVTLGVIARGLIGDRLGERSLLFRAYYWEAALRIFASHPGEGVGPSQFKNSYLLLKNPLNPEEITSPHNVLLDFTSTLGLGGLAWAALFGIWIWRLGVAMARTDDGEESPLDLRREIRPVVLAISGAAIFGIWIELGAASPEGAIARVLGLILGIAVAAGVLARLARSPKLAGCAAGASALAMLSLIDMGPVFVGSAPWFMALLSVCGHTPPDQPVSANTRRAGELASRRIIVGAALLSIAVASWLAFRLAPWQSLLRQGEEAVLPTATLRQQLQSILSRDSRATPEDRAMVELELTRLTGLTFAAPAATLFEGVENARMKAVREAFDLLNDATTELPTHNPTREAACRLALQLADWYRSRHQDAELKTMTDEALRLAHPVLLQTSDSPSLTWQAGVVEAVGEMRGDDPKVWGPAAIDLHTQAAALDPYSLIHVVKLADLCTRLARPDQAASWATKALKLNEYTRLDPSNTRGLTSEQLARLKAMLPINPAPKAGSGGGS